ncbi:extracellular solute-binding protein, family 1 [Treponema primitia ZAS-2]|uniref:Extracellular solute-binding protein, family 1 n=1 Tax=Treponema primitia (strain ATCC BAA-887 / DSM 12427 / ZAS-2) TaxID=545694 RepID=F5YMR9_TREPZ|nr:ABC transporter substrate-binding protein [Treponema primitia]AEF84731.1 extracellular solute-binding protein, family 1 [Treponema primitia ZAS-2]
MQKSIRFFLALALFGGIAAGLAAGGGKEDKNSGGVSKNLVVYSNTSEDFMSQLIPAFESKYGVKVEVISASGGELMNRLTAEKDNPIADVLIGGGKSLLQNSKDLFEPYHSPEAAFIEEVAQDPDNYFTGFEFTTHVLLVNRNVVGNIKIESYADLLQPQLAKKVVFGNAAKSNSAFSHLGQILDGFAIAEGKRYESDSGWSYVEKLLKHGIMLESSGNIHKSVADGEYGVALTWEAPSVTYMKDGAKHLEIVYPRECLYFAPSTVQIVKGGANPQNARLFVDFVISEEMQGAMGTTTSSRPVRKNAALASYFKPYSDIERIVGKNHMDYPEEWIIQNTKRIQAQFNDLMTRVLQ